MRPPTSNTQPSRRQIEQDPNPGRHCVAILAAVKDRTASPLASRTSVYHWPGPPGSVHIDAAKHKAATISTAQPDNAFAGSADM